MTHELFKGIVRKKPDRCTRVAWRVEEWPARDRALWNAAVKPGERFEESRPGAHLRPRTRTSLIYAHGRWLAFLCKTDALALEAGPAERLTRVRLAAFCRELASTNSGWSIASLLRHLRGAVRLMEPSAPCDVAMTIAKQIQAQSHTRPKYPRLRPLLELYQLALKLMDDAEAEVDRTGHISAHVATDYRDGLLIGLLVMAPLRRANVTELRSGQQLARTGPVWTIVLPDEEMKNNREAEYVLSRRLSDRVDRYLTLFRPAFLNSEKHDGLWASIKGRPMGDQAIYDAVCRRTKEEFGTAMNLHLFRDAAASFWADVAPDEIHLVRDLLGHADLRTTEQHYRHANTIRAGRMLTQVLEEALAPKPAGPRMIGSQS
jgi:integrase/recombinase XerD